MKKKISLIIISIIITFLSGCVTGTFQYRGKIKNGSWLRNIKISYEFEGKKSKTRIQMYLPENYRKGASHRLVVLLHGRNGTLKDWEEKTRIEKYADEYNMVLVCPDMKNTQYETKFYPETEYRWGPMPGGRFVREVLLNYLADNFALGYEREKTAIMGVSTGARGALLAAAKGKSRFGAAAGLSGYYDPASMTNSYQIKSVYGPFEDNKDRWKNDDNIMLLAENLQNVAVYLWHGGKDYIIPRGQSMLLAMKLKHLQKRDGGYKVKYKEAKYFIHTWKHWGLALPDIMEYLNENMAELKE